MKTHIRIPSTSVKREIALQTLGRYTPQDCDQAEQLVSAAQEVIRDDLKQGVMPTARWLVGRYESARAHEYEGIADQLRPLIKDLGPCVAQDGELAARVQPIARALGLDELRQACVTAANAALRAGIARRRKAG